MRIATWGLALLIAGWFAVTMGWMMNFGALPQHLASGLPFLAADASMPIAFALFFVGTCGIILVGFFASLIMQGVGRLRA
jgi:hypothetical protein